MNVDPTNNTIVFEVKRLWKKENHIEQSPTQAGDGIKTAWLAVQSKTGAKPAQVRQVYSEWEPSEEDSAFLSATFPNAKISFSFPRPAADGWEQALAEASQTMLASVGEEVMAEARERRDKGQTMLLPVLRTYEAGDVFAETIVHRIVGADLAVFLAHIGPTPRGTIGMEYVMRNSVEKSEQAVDRLFEEAWQNLGSGLKVGLGESENVKVFTLSHPSDMAASALCLPNFYEQARSWLGQDEVLVAFTDPANLFVTMPGSSAADKMREAVQQSEYWGAVALTPACYVLDGGGMRQVAIRKASA